MRIFHPSNRFLGAALAAAFFALPLLGAAEVMSVEPTESPELAKLDEVIVKGLADHVYPGAVVVVGTPDEVLFAKAYGKMTFDEDAAPMKMDTIFDLASVSKPTGAGTAALLLIEDGRLSLDEKVSKYIPGFEAGGKESATIKNLMTHTSGLKAYDSYPVVEEMRKQGESHSDALIRRYASLEASYPPNTSYKYSCLNFQTLARVDETVLGTRLEPFLKERVWDKLGMSETGYLLTKEQIERCAPTQVKKDGSVIVGYVHDPLANYHGSEVHCPGNAGLFSTAPDLARYLAMVVNGGSLGGVQVFKPETIAMATSVQTPEGVEEERGLGFDVYESDGYSTDLNRTSDTYIIGHTGYTGTMIWFDKLSKTYMVLLTNRTYPDDASKPAGKRISDVRKGACDAILRSRPEYADYFAKKDAEEAVAKPTE